MKKMDFRSLYLLAAAFLLGNLFSSCRRDVKEQGLAQKSSKDSSKGDDAMALQPEETCKAIETYISSMQTYVCKNQNSALCGQFQSFLQGEVPSFSETDSFTIGREITLPVEGQIDPKDDGKDFMVLVIHQGKNISPVFGLTDLRTYTAGQTRAMENYVLSSSLLSQEQVKTLTGVIRNGVDSTFFSLSAPLTCGKSLYFPMSQKEDQPSDVIVRKQGRMLYILALIHTPKRDKITSAYFSVMQEPNVFTSMISKAENPSEIAPVSKSTDITTNAQESVPPVATSKEEVIKGAVALDLPSAQEDTKNKGNIELKTPKRKSARKNKK